MEAVSHKICLVHRERRDVVDSKSVVAPMTRSIQSRLANQDAKPRTIRPNPHIGPWIERGAGNSFEAAVQRYPKDETNLEWCISSRAERGPYF